MVGCVAAVSQFFPGPLKQRGDVMDHAMIASSPIALGGGNGGVRAAQRGFKRTLATQDEEAREAELVAQRRRYMAELAQRREVHADDFTDVAGALAAGAPAASASADIDLDSGGGSRSGPDDTAVAPPLCAVSNDACPPVPSPLASSPTGLRSGLEPATTTGTLAGGPIAPPAPPPLYDGDDGGGRRGAKWKGGASAANGGRAHSRVRGCGEDDVEIDASGAEPRLPSPPSSMDAHQKEGRGSGSLGSLMGLKHVQVSIDDGELVMRLALNVGGGGGLNSVLDHVTLTDIGVLLQHYRHIDPSPLQPLPQPLPQPQPQPQHQPQHQPQLQPKHEPAPPPPHYPYGQHYHQPPPPPPPPLPPPPPPQPQQQVQSPRAPRLPPPPASRAPSSDPPPQPGSYLPPPPQQLPPKDLNSHLSLELSQQPPKPPPPSSAVFPSTRTTSTAQLTTQRTTAVLAPAAAVGPAALPSAASLRPFRSGDASSLVAASHAPMSMPAINHAVRYHQHPQYAHLVAGGARPLLPTRPPMMMMPYSTMMHTLSPEWPPPLRGISSAMLASADPTTHAVVTGRAHDVYGAFEAQVRRRRDAAAAELHCERAAAREDETRDETQPQPRQPQAHSCPFEGCSKRFATESKMRHHLRAHRKLFVCPRPECARRFGYKCDLQRHVEKKVCQRATRLAQPLSSSHGALQPHSGAREHAAVAVKSETAAAPLVAAQQGGSEAPATETPTADGSGGGARPPRPLPLSIPPQERKQSPQRAPRGEPSSQQAPRGEPASQQPPPPVRGGGGMKAESDSGWHADETWSLEMDGSLEMDEPLDAWRYADEPKELLSLEECSEPFLVDGKGSLVENTHADKDS